MAQEDRGCSDCVQGAHEEGYKRSESVLVPPTLLVRQHTRQGAILNDGLMFRKCQGQD